MGADGLEELLSLMGEGAGAGKGEADGVKTRRLPAEPLDCGFRLTFQVFSCYVQCLGGVFRPLETWEDLRLKLSLEPMEPMVMSEDYVIEGGGGGVGMMAGLTGSGSLFLTSQHLFLHLSTRQQVRVIPLASVRGVRASSTRKGPFALCESIDLLGCQAWMRCPLLCTCPLCCAILNFVRTFFP
ncbi:unnamed protein product [Choristocarpus tenellus]